MTTRRSAEPEGGSRGGPVGEGRAHLDEVGHDLDLAGGTHARRAVARSSSEWTTRLAAGAPRRRRPRAAGESRSPADPRGTKTSCIVTTSGASQRAPHAPRVRGSPPSRGPQSASFHWRWTTSASRSRWRRAAQRAGGASRLAGVALDDLEIGPRAGLAARIAPVASQSAALAADVQVADAQGSLPGHARPSGRSQVPELAQQGAMAPRRSSVRRTGSSDAPPAPTRER